MDKQAVLEQIREEAFRNEMEKMALSDALYARIGKKLDIEEAANWLSATAHPIIRKNTRKMIEGMVNARGNIKRLSKEGENIRNALNSIKSKMWL